MFVRPFSPVVVPEYTKNAMFVRPFSPVVVPE